VIFREVVQFSESSGVRGVRTLGVLRDRSVRVCERQFEPFNHFPRSIPRRSTRSLNLAPFLSSKPKLTRRLIVFKTRKDGLLLFSAVFRFKLARVCF